MTYEQFHAHQAGCSRHPAFRNRDFDESCVTQTGTGASAGIFDGTAASDIAASGWTDDVYLGLKRYRNDKTKLEKLYDIVGYLAFSL